MAGLQLDWRKGLALQRAVELLPECYRATHIPSRVNVRGYDPIVASVTFSPDCTLCCGSPVRVELSITVEDSQDVCGGFKSRVTRSSVVTGPAAR
jgi:hypothetical protein